MVGRRCGGFLMERLERVRMGAIWKKDREGKTEPMWWLTKTVSRATIEQRHITRGQKLGRGGAFLSITRHAIFSFSFLLLNIRQLIPT
jgi:hypothetical protein